MTENIYSDALGSGTGTCITYESSLDEFRGDQAMADQWVDKAFDPKKHIDQDVVRRFQSEVDTARDKVRLLTDKIAQKEKEVARTRSRYLRYLRREERAESMSLGGLFDRFSQWGYDFCCDGPPLESRSNQTYWAELEWEGVKRELAVLRGKRRRAVTEELEHQYRIPAYLEARRSRVASSLITSDEGLETLRRLVWHVGKDPTVMDSVTDERIADGNGWACCEIETRSIGAQTDDFLDEIDAQIGFMQDGLPWAA